ncbi:M3 family metallopeptidase [Nitrosovibrio sp. Nv6]|uniref:M3 family metallopeptidase n=1 Tax=Nitrosovibrio sp. Nv6 TaxID=1855340 RepID=UPI0008C81AA1|nr:M3 family metallopeptidase [Nitrosovibrio sp. Nv6]SEP25823.1 oligopeptidase A [Nitrosovibrio sp. Nv6]
MNPLLDFSGLPRFADIRTEHITPAVKQLLAENHAMLDSIRNDTSTPAWDNFVQPMTDANERLSRAWGQVSHLNAVKNTPELREAYNANLPLITQYYAELAQDQVLFGKFKQLRSSNEFENLSPARKKIIEDDLRDFRLGGAELSPEKKERFLHIQEELSALGSRFNDNLLDATNNFALQVENADEVSGIPDDVLQTAREAAEKDNVPGWKFTLHAPSYLPVMQYADNRKLREKMYRAYSTRASEIEAGEIEAPAPPAGGTADLDNTPLIARMLQLRKEEAQLLGFECYAEVSLAAKMASTPKQVLDFLGELAAKARPYAERDLKELRQFAGDKLQLEALEAWDIAYASEKLRLERYAFSEQEVKQYFPETSVLPGMFKLVESLYGIVITLVDAADAQLWHPDVKLFNITDTAGNLVGRFYLDLYARPGKRGGGWMDDAVSRRRIGAECTGEYRIQTPVAYLNCNFSAPVRINGESRPALFTHDDVITLFHEFGHGLHHLLTQVEDLGVSGIHGVEWDAVELPSQFMENFCWEWDVLHNMTRRVGPVSRASDDSASGARMPDGEPIPRELFDKMLAAKNFQSGLQMLRQIEFALFDMHLHSDFDPNGGKTAQQLLDEIREQVAVIIPPKFNRFPNSFSHIFGGGYAAGYYSYKWAEVLSADAYSLFEEAPAGGVINRDTGIRFRNEILAVGGSRPALESFIAFRGREPKIDALLRHNGMAIA